MVQGIRPPENAEVMHARLQELGVVDRVRRVLMAADTTENVTELTCWVARSQGDLLVWASYMNHKKNLVSGKSEGEHLDFARFRVARGAAFGPIGSPALPDNLVASIQAIH